MRFYFLIGRINNFFLKLRWVIKYAFNRKVIIIDKSITSLRSQTRMLLGALVLIIMQARLGAFQCNVCVTQQLITSNVECSSCSTIDGQHGTIENYKKVTDCVNEELDCFNDTMLYDDNNNPIDWETCNVSTTFCNANDKYRTYDGSCNNLKHPTWGMAGTAFTRLLPASYRDGKHLIRLATNEKELPHARELSTNIFSKQDAPDTITLMAMQWGQVVAHDIVFTPSLESLDCCDPSTYNEETCLQFIYSPNDYFYSKYNITCESLKRRKYTTIKSNCKDGPAQQINMASHPIDGSLIYGSDESTANNLRAFVGGRLRIRTLRDGREFLPNVPLDQVTSKCFVRSKTEPCYIAGDDRVNQNTEFSAVSNLLLRTHNRIADSLQKIHANWNDEKLFQETRRIFVAILQHIHYKEWLQFYIGRKNMIKYNLFPKNYGYTKYNSKINLIGINSFHVAAFRVGHSGIQGLLKMYNHDQRVNDSVLISDWMNRPLIVEKGCNYDKFLLGLVNQPMQKLDEHFTEQMTNLMFRGFKPYGKDLLSTDILRGRDHGIAPYVHYLQLCTGFKATTFNSLRRFMTNKSVNLLKRNYNAVEDIDLMVGGTLEKLVPGSRLGPTFMCMFIEQFYRLKWGDRYWYEVSREPHSFTKDQLKEIRQITVSKLICDSSDRIKKMPLNSFLPVSESNQMQDCDKIPGIDLSKF